MSEHTARITWVRETETIEVKKYNREHRWTFKNGAVIRASSAPNFLGSPECVDPEDAFVASISSCHMLTFLYICSRQNIVVERYDDAAVGYLGMNDQKRLAMTRVVLRPKIEFAPGHQPTPEALSQLHEHAHRDCFIATSVVTEVTVEAPVTASS